MKKEYLIYSLAIGINRGTLLLYLPFLTYSLSIGDFGVYSYIQMLFQVINPILCFNITSGIAREGADSPNKGLSVYNTSITYVFFIIAITTLFTYLIEKNFSVEWLVAIIVLAGLEAIHNMQLSIYRVFDKHKIYLGLVAAKTVGFGIIIFILIYLQQMNLKTLLTAQIIWYFLIFFTFGVKRYLREGFNSLVKVDLKPIVIFSLLLIPHVISQWAMSAVNRVIVKNILGDVAMGIYSVSYSLALVILLINSGIAIVLPQNFIRNKEYWLKTSVRAYFSKLYALVVILCYFLIVLLLYLDNKFFGLVKIINYETIYYFSILTSAFLLLGYYYYYANILFYYKKSKIISLVTFTTAFFSIVLSYFCTKKIGLVGASYSTLATYVFYLILIAYFAKKYESTLKLKWSTDFLIPVISLIVIILSGFFSRVIF